jgi:hypothetical protein
MFILLADKDPVHTLTLTCTHPDDSEFNLGEKAPALSVGLEIPQYRYLETVEMTMFCDPAS